MRVAKGKFISTIHGWGVLVSGSPKSGDEISVLRKSDKTVVTVLVEKVLSPSWMDNKALCSFVEKKTVNVSTLRDASIIVPSEYARNSAVTNRMAQRQFDAEYDPSDIDDALGQMKPSKNYRRR